MSDPISRQAVLDMLNDINDHIRDGVGYRHDWCVEWIKGLPSASRWIPVTERLPEELEEVNITWINTDPELYYDSIRGKHFSGSAVYYKGRWYWYSAVCTDYLREYGFSPNDEMDDAIKVIAWMSMPEPYREDGGT